MKSFAIAVLFCLLITACGGEDGSDYEADHVGTAASASILDPDGNVVGTAEFEQGPTGVLITVAMSGLTPGAHGIHLHEVGACTPDFKAAGGHITATDEAQHGLKNPQRTVDNHDNGDLPNLYAAADGIAHAEFFTSLVTVSGGSMPSLLDADGSTLVIHENPDDHITQPIGGAGGRVGCGIIQ
ncbi:MAG: superoxide dismutase family protein [bacterium]|nr:superoxide dismutase family protein [bacterium]MCY3632858.1 superoxide dismutase family protein [bacterium]